MTKWLWLNVINFLAITHISISKFIKNVVANFLVLHDSILLFFHCNTRNEERDKRTAILMSQSFLNFKTSLLESSIFNCSKITTSLIVINLFICFGIYLWTSSKAASKYESLFQERENLICSWNCILLISWLLFQKELNFTWKLRTFETIKWHARCGQVEHDKIRLGFAM